MENRSFWKENKGILLFEPVFILIILLLSNLYEIKNEYTFYVVAFSVILWGMSIFSQLIMFRRMVEKYKQEDRKKQYESDKEALKWQMMREKEDFFAMWTHQIKTPIAALNVLLQSEQQDIFACKQELFKIENYVEMALNYLRFEGMGNDMLLVECDLNRMIRQVVKKFATIFIHKHLAVNLDNLSYRILTDEKWFVFVLEQILLNALKYTNEGAITISAKEEMGRLSITVKDTGIGIKSEDIPRLFEKGFTGYNGRMDKKASGLGLYLCKGVCNQLGHGLKVESVEGEGTVVTLEVYGENVNKSDLTKM